MRVVAARVSLFGKDKRVRLVRGLVRGLFTRQDSKGPAKRRHSATLRPSITLIIELEPQEKGTWKYLDESQLSSRPVLGQLSPIVTTYLLRYFEWNSFPQQQGKVATEISVL